MYSADKKKNKKEDLITGLAGPGQAYPPEEHKTEQEAGNCRVTEQIAPLLVVESESC